MRFVFPAAFGLLLAGCSSTDTGTPAAACNSAISAVCNKASSCNSLGTISVQECITVGESAANCATASCGVGKTYNSSAASQCISDINALNCTDANNDYQNGTLPSSCNGVCQ